MKLIVYSAIAVALLFFGCSKDCPNDGLPSYIFIESFEFETDFFSEGTDSQKITEVWVYSEGEMVGIFDLPAMVPILKSGPTPLLIAAGIKNNGISADRIRYPFYTTWEVEPDLTPLEVDTLVPDFQYLEGLQIVFREEFEDAGIAFSNTSGGQSQMALTEVEGEVFEGTGSGLIILTDEFPILRAQTEAQIPVTPGGRIFMELNYSSNNSFAVGVHANPNSNNSAQLALIINPSKLVDGLYEWNKIYVDLSNVIGATFSAATHEVYIEAVKDEGVTEAMVLLDNIKIIQFPN